MRNFIFHPLRNLLPRTLFARSLLIIVIPVLLLQVVTTIVFVDNHWRKVTSRLAFSVAGEVAFIADQLDGHYTEKRFESVSESYAQKLDLLVSFEPRAKLVPERVAHGAWKPIAANALARALEEKLHRPFSLSFSPDDNWVNIGVQLNDGVLRVLVLERRLYTSSVYIFILWVIGTSTILFAIAVFFMRNQIRPIRKLALMAERMGKGQDLPPFKPEGAREVRQAARAFIDMHERITRQADQRTTMLAGVSHDLRTPLTRLKLGLSMMEESEDIIALKQDVTDMEGMLHSYLNFLRGDGDEANASVSLLDMVEKVAFPVRRHGKSVHVEIDKNLVIDARPLAFSRAIQNLLSNADKYATEIWVSAKPKTDNLIIMVDDNGSGLDPDLFEEVFKPFYRADSSRNASTGGVGLGLSVVRDIVHAHGGDVHLEQSPRGGLRAVIEIPI